ncbi:CRAL/TRIO domain-containing protein [Testicularia cyperi]|uniref:CRAL/TRIO domain-containing protein n=1 Tax=Testicularia cyperi TaxID=1882483 RepID=A0A317XHB3_9BASI|nr:CRAL/TRIO domain-containing protein [Testicularia cyperi]
MSSNAAGLSKTHSRASSTGSRSSTLFGRASGFMMGHRRPQAASESQASPSSSTADLAATSSRPAKSASEMRSFQHIFPAPDPSIKPTKPAPLSEQQEEKYQEMLSHFTSVTEFPTSLKSDSPKEPPTEWEKLRMLTRESMLRYLRATKWDVTSAKKRLTDTIAWRREYGVDRLRAEDLEPEAMTGKETILGFDNKGRPLHYMHPSRNTTDESPRQMQFAVWILERAIDVMPPGVEMLALLINFGGKKRNPTSISNAKLMLYILQNHYVERLGIALCINVPWIFKAFWNAIYPFIDPVTKAKCKFDEAIKDEVPNAQLAADFGGLLDFPYNHELYWPQLIALTEKRREEQLERFRTLCNSEIGASEWDIRGGEEFNRPLKANKQDSGYHEVEAMSAPGKLPSSKAASEKTSSTVVEKPPPIYEGEGVDDDLDRFYTTQTELPPPLDRERTTSDWENKTVVNDEPASITPSHDSAADKSQPNPDTHDSHKQHHLFHLGGKHAKHSSADGDASLFAAVVGGISAGLVGGKAASGVSEQSYINADKQSELHDVHNHVDHSKALADRRSDSPHSTPAVQAA